MNATTNFTVKSLRANKVRTLVTIAGVALAAALLTAVLTTFVSLNDYLYRSEAHLAGTWMSCVEADGSAELDEKIAAAQNDAQVSGTAIMRDVGFAELTVAQQDQQGTYLAIRSIEGDVGDICGIVPSEGRLPENEHEIMLFATWNDYGGVNLGDEVTFNVGQRTARLAPGEEGSMSAGTMSASWGVQEEGPRERDHRRHAAQLLHGRAGGGHRRRHLQRGGHEHRGAHLHRRGLLRPSGLRPFHRCGHGGRDRRGRCARRLYRRVPHAERRDQHPAGGRGRRGAVPR
ncbi:MAG: hypothetical protein ACLTDR_04380 [Adlercreutzia equolifaciens]